MYDIVRKDEVTLPSGGKSGSISTRYFDIDWTFTQYRHCVEVISRRAMGLEVYKVNIMSLLVCMTMAIEKLDEDV